MKRVLFSALCAFCASALWAQSIAIFHGDKQIEPGATIQFNFGKTYVDEQMGDAMCKLHVKNLKDGVNAVRFQNIGEGISDLAIAKVQNGKASFCVTTCVSENPVPPFKLEPNGSFEVSAHLSFYDYENETPSPYGSYLMKYVAEEGSLLNSEDLSSFVPNGKKFLFFVDFNYSENGPNGIQSTSNGSCLNMVQVGDQMILDYQFKEAKSRKLIVSNISAQQIFISTLELAKGTCKIAGLDAGIYVYSIYENNAIVATNKFLIK